MRPLHILFFAAIAISSARADVVFKILPGEETGLKAIMEKWNADELQRQGGKFVDHGWWPWGLEAWDYNNDGAIDLLAQQHGAPQTIILKSLLKEKGTLTFVNANSELGLPTNALAGCFKPTIIDIDGDGFLDLVYSDALPNTVFFNRAGKAFEPMGTAFGQLDHIGNVNEIGPLGYPEVGNETTRYSYDPTSKKYKSHSFDAGYYAKPPECIAAFLADAKAKKENRFLHLQYFENVSLGSAGHDVVCAGFASYGGENFGRYLSPDKDGKLADITDQLGLPKVGCPILFADFNNDGFDDVLIAGAGLYLSDGKGKYALKPGPVTDYIKKVGPYLHKAFPVDFDNKGRMDLVLNNPRGLSVAIFENLGNGDFKLLHTTAAWDADPVAICDINDDGLMDVCVGGPGDSITIFLNQSTNTGHGCLIYPSMEKPNPFAVGMKLEFFAAGSLDKPGARPLQTNWANSNGTPIHFGLGNPDTFDLQITYPGDAKRTVKFKDVVAKKKLKITREGNIEELK